MKNINKKYWDLLYSENNQIPVEHSQFADFVVENLYGDEKILDVACGNCRDSIFFIKSGFDVTSIDISSNIFNIKVDGLKFLKTDMLDFDYSGFDVVYLRFTVHTIDESSLDLLINQIKSTANRKCKIFIETRSTKGITDEEKSETYFKSGIGSEHFRMLYSKEYLTKKIQRHFNVLYNEEDINFSAFNGENPYCIRLILSNND